MVEEDDDLPGTREVGDEAGWGLSEGKTLSADISDFLRPRHSLLQTNLEGIW